MQALQHLDGARILLGISGGIAAYKTPQLVRLLRDGGADVQVVMTRSAGQFVTATTLQAVSGRAVRNDLWDPAAEAAMGHIELARWADVVLVAPATADVVSRLATGRADDLLSTLCLATRAPILLAPAMNQVMWEKPATQRNCESLMTDGVRLIGPGVGDQACGETGPGRMEEPEMLRDAVVRELQHASEPSVETLPALRKLLAGRRLLITAGPTREAIDPVRYLSNHSSGKQGYAIAATALEAGATVTLISGPVGLTPVEGATFIAVESAREMQAAVIKELPHCDMFVGVAAVADYRPANVAPRKIKKDPAPGTKSSLTLNLVENPDIIAEVAGHSSRPFVVGFAAETHDAIAHGASKRERKGMDLMVVNDVSDTSIGFGSENNAVTLIWDGGQETVPPQSKAAVARALLTRAGRLFVDQLAAANPEASQNS